MFGGFTSKSRGLKLDDLALRNATTDRYPSAKVSTPYTHAQYSCRYTPPSHPPPIHRNHPPWRRTAPPNPHRQYQQQNSARMAAPLQIPNGQLCKPSSTSYTNTELLRARIPLNSSSARSTSVYCPIITLLSKNPWH